MTDRIDTDKAYALREMRFEVGPRDPRLNTAFLGSFMVCEAFDDSETPTEDGRNGPWCIVGDNLGKLIDDAYSFWGE